MLVLFFFAQMIATILFSNYESILEKIYFVEGIL